MQVSKGWALFWIHYYIVDTKVGTLGKTVQSAGKAATAATGQSFGEADQDGLDR